MAALPSNDSSVALAELRPPPINIDGELVRSRLLSAMFGATSPAPRFGRFELRERIGEGGMGVVYRAWDPQLERAVAIKLIDTTGFAASVRELALQEARNLARLTHANVITVFEAGLADEHVWIAMEYVPGPTMREALSRSPRPDRTSILRDWIAVGRGLMAVHAAGLVHRDVKPSNVLIGADGRPRLIDFGLVRAPDEHAAAAAVSSASDPADFVGTRAYAAPEQLRGGEVDARSDQYSFCVSLWEMLCEQRPPPPARGGALPAPPQLPARLHRLLARGLAEDPAARFPSLAELLSGLETIVAGPSRRAGLLLGAATLGAVVAGSVVGQWREPAPTSEPCQIGPAALAGAWDEHRRTRLRARFAGGELAFAAGSLAAVEAGIDAWAADWLAARKSACVATWVEGVQSSTALDLRDGCLDRQRRALEITLDTLEHAGTRLPLAAQAPALLAGLPDLGECADPERLAEVDPLPPAGPRRDAVLRGYDVLSEARTLAATGMPTSAAAQVATFVAEFPESSIHPPLRLELAALPAQLDLLRQHVAQGVAPLVLVARQAAGRRLDELAATLFVQAAEAAAGHWAKPELERWLLADAEAALARIARPRDPRRVSLRAAQAALLADSGRLDEALAGYEEARALAHQLDDAVRTEAQNLNVAAILAELGRYDDARTALTTGREGAQRRWGPGAPMVARHDFDLALLDLDIGDHAAARLHLDAAEAVFRAAFGADSLYVARVQAARAKLRMDEGDFAAARTLFSQAIVVYARELGEDHDLLVELHEGVGVLRFLTGDLTGSITAYETALRIKIRVAGPEHPGVARLHSNLGESQAALGRLAEARASFDRSLTIYAASLPADHPDLALPLKCRAQVNLAAGRVREAIADLERALALRLRAGSEPLEIADLRFSLARALRKQEGRPSHRTKDLARLARLDFAARNMGTQVAAIDAWSRG